MEKYTYQIITERLALMKCQKDNDGGTKLTISQLIG